MICIGMFAMSTLQFGTMSDYHHGNLREGLVRAGLELLEEVGSADISLRAVAARAGVSHAAPKNHFGDMRGLLTAIGAEGFRRHRIHMLERFSQTNEDPEKRLAAVAESYVEFAKSHPGLFRLMFTEERLDMSNLELKEAARGSYAVLESVTKGLRYSSSDSLPAGLSGQLLIWSLVHGFAHLALVRNYGPSAGRLGIVPKLSDIWPKFTFSDPTKDK